MRFRTFIVAYALVLALLLFADRRPNPGRQERYSKVADLTDSQLSATRIISPAALIPGTWGAGQIPAERLVAPLVVMDVNAGAPLTVDDIATWEARHGNVPQGAIVAFRQPGPPKSAGQFPATADAAQFLMDARYTLGFIIESPANLGPDRTLARQIALHGNYIVEGSARMVSLPDTGSLIIVAPTKTTSAAIAPVRVLAMVH